MSFASPSPYQPRYDRGNCGMGFVADRHNRASHALLRMGLEALNNLQHRGALVADARTGDGAGVLTPLPRDLFVREVERLTGKGVAPDQLGVGVFFLLRATRQRNVPAVVVSALGDPADIDRAYDEFGIFAFVEKEGFDRRNFLRLLAEALQAGRDAAPAEAAAPANPAFEALTPREREVLALLIHGHTNRQIAEALLITPNTTKKHVDHILQKLGVSTRAGAVAVALREG